MRIYKLAENYFSVSVHEGDEPIIPEHGNQPGWILVEEDVPQFRLREVINNLFDIGYGRESILIENQKMETVSHNGKEINFSLSRSDKMHGCKMVYVDVEKFDRSFQQDKDFYIGEGGSDNAIGDRYNRFQEFLGSGSVVEVSSVYVDENGSVFFGNGRHRYAVLRDMGLRKIPVAMTEESIQNAKKFGLIV